MTSVLPRNLRQQGRIWDPLCAVPPQAHALTPGTPLAFLPLGKVVRARGQGQGAGQGPRIRPGMLEVSLRAASIHRWYLYG